ncbi:hypothetical protein MKW94_023076 [Papaver nudicaule]|uniref:BZIP domain-containing protein n=1 Tax=Papaver nudicaule TaxID=74823 RepID=A0AA41S9R4_PAPNU|nr:hypothetical protein [Papaver nudicaule]
MDDGEIDFLNRALQNMEHQLLSSCAMDSFFDDRLDKTHAGTHANTSNQPEQNPDLPRSPDYTHFGPENHPVEEKTTSEESNESVERRSKKRPHGNRESVRKYRERKKARQASMEDEVIRLRIINQQLLKRLQGLVALEQEVERFKCLLVDIRGRIKGELGSFPFRKPATGMPRLSTSVGATDVNQCDHQYPGFDNNSGANVKLSTNVYTSSAAATKRRG